MSGAKCQRESRSSDQCGPPSLTLSFICRTRSSSSPSDTVGGCSRSSASSHLDRPLVQPVRRNPSPGRNSRKNLPSISSSSLDPFSSSLELARSARTQCLVGTTPSAHYCCWRSRFSCCQRALGETNKHKEVSRRSCISLRNHEGGDSLSPSSNLSLVYHCLLTYTLARLLSARCTSRGVWHNLGESSSLIETETDSVCAQKEHDFHERSSSFT